MMELKVSRLQFINNPKFVTKVYYDPKIIKSFIDTCMHTIKILNVYFRRTMLPLQREKKSTMKKMKEVIVNMRKKKKILALAQVIPVMTISEVYTKLNRTFLS